jgi:hypothetical protein
MPRKLMHCYSQKEMQISMAQRCLHSSWTGSLTPSSTDLQAGYTLQALISANFPSSPCLPCFPSVQTFIFNGLTFGRPTITMVHFRFQFCQKRQNKIKRTITNLQSILGEDPINEGSCSSGGYKVSVLNATSTMN